MEHSRRRFARPRDLFWCTRGRESITFKSRGPTSQANFGCSLSRRLVRAHLALAPSTGLAAARGVCGMGLCPRFASEEICNADECHVLQTKQQLSSR